METISERDMPRDGGAPNVGCASTDGFPEVSVKVLSEKDFQHGLDWGGENVAGWDASEKFDGCRAYWDGAVMWSRGGKRVQLPEHLAAQLPPGMAMDGELYHPKRARESVAQTMRGRGKGWEGMCFMAFDAPAAAGTWRQRLLSIPRTVFCQPVVPWTMASTEEAWQIARTIQRRGGEGLMLRRPGLRYRSGRTGDVLKMK